MLPSRACTRTPFPIVHLLVKGRENILISLSADWMRIRVINNLIREIFAALRLDIPNAWQMPQAPHWVTYDFPSHVREKLKHQWGSDWKGQAQKWFLFKFTGKDEEINLLGDGSEKPEFWEWSWMSPEQVIDHAVDFKKPVYKEVLAAFTPFLQ